MGIAYLLVGLLVHDESVVVGGLVDDLSDLEMRDATNLERITVRRETLWLIEN